MELIKGCTLLVRRVGSLTCWVAHWADGPQLVDGECPHYRTLHRRHHSTATSASSVAVTEAIDLVSNAHVTALRTTLLLLCWPEAAEAAAAAVPGLSEADPSPPAQTARVQKRSCHRHAGIVDAWFLLLRCGAGRGLA